MFTPPDTIFNDRGLVWMVCRHPDLQSGSRAICQSSQDQQNSHQGFLAANSTRIFPFARVGRSALLATEMKSGFILVTHGRRRGRDQFYEQSGGEERCNDNQERYHARSISTRNAMAGPLEIWRNLVQKLSTFRRWCGRAGQKRFGPIGGKVSPNISG